jgi:hypothetical protein
MHDLSIFERMIRTAEFRCLTKMEKAIKLINENNVSLRDAAHICGIRSHSTISAAMKAIREKRAIGINGRPKIFSED